MWLYQSRRRVVQCWAAGLVEDESSLERCLSIECGDAWGDLMRGELRREWTRPRTRESQMMELLYDSRLHATAETGEDWILIW